MKSPHLTSKPGGTRHNQPKIFCCKEVEGTYHQVTDRLVPCHSYLPSWCRWRQHHRKILLQMSQSTQYPGLKELRCHAEEGNSTSYLSLSSRYPSLLEAWCIGVPSPASHAMKKPKNPKKQKKSPLWDLSGKELKIRSILFNWMESDPSELDLHLSWT